MQRTAPSRQNHFVIFTKTQAKAVKLWGNWTCNVLWQGRCLQEELVWSVPSSRPWVLLASVPILHLFHNNQMKSYSETQIICGGITRMQGMNREISELTWRRRRGWTNDGKWERKGAEVGNGVHCSRATVKSFGQIDRTLLIHIYYFGWINHSIS